MNNNVLLAFIVNILPKLTLVFVSLVFLYKIYFKIRCSYSARVNCWFCNENSKVPYLESNSWTCTKCEQYNGFSKDGGYNREIIQQFECGKSNNSLRMNFSFWPTQSNGFCDACNEAQRLKVEKLSQFEPKRESRFDEELKVFKTQLEDQYRLCASCDRHLKSVLRDKKKMVLGSKFLEYIIKGAEAIKHPNYNLLRHAKQELWKSRLSALITVLTIVNLFCLFGSLPELSRTWFNDVFGVSFGTQFFIACSHMAALWRVLSAYISIVTQNDFVIRLGLFARTIFMMLLYSLGLRLPHLVRLNFLSLYLLAAPFCILASTFSYNVIDRFQITRYTLLLVLWSLYAGGLIETNILPTQQVLMFLTSVFTCLLTFTNKTQHSSKLYNNTANSLHKIYADDYLSDGDTATSSILSHQFDYSSVSSPSDLNRSFHSMQHSPLQSYKKKSPLTSSTLSLNLATHHPHHPYDKTSPLSSSMLSLNLTPQRSRHESTLNSSFRSCYGSDNNSTLRPRFGNSVYSFAAPSRNPFMGSSSNLDLSNFNHTRNYAFGNASFFASKSKANDFQQRLATPTPSFRSAFGASDSALRQQERTSYLLSPSRFSLNTNTVGFTKTINNDFTRNESLNQLNRSNTMSKTSNLFLDRRNGVSGMCAIEEDLSRASSRSSGFESQSGYMNNSRENSFCAETNDLNKRTAFLDTSSQFRTIDSNNVSGLNTSMTARPLLSPYSTCTQPLSINCNSEWHTSSRSNSLSRDAFNLGRFNQNLPNFKRGDLLKRWKEGEVRS